MVTAELAHQSANLGRLTRVTLTHCVQLIFFSLVRKEKKRKEPLRGKKGKENGS
jgi:hypothetical protein